MATVLVVAAHPDDEALGCGGTIARRARNGDTVSVVFLADGVTSRESAAGDVDERNQAAKSACALLGAAAPVFLGFPDNRLDTVALLDIVQALEAQIERCKPEVIYTHHGGDLNVDHRLAHAAVMTACRPQPGASVREIYSFEVMSSTEWAPATAPGAFVPNCFVDIADTVDVKMKALKAYAGEMRAFPHSRSFEAVEALARYRGASAGMTAAEAFSVERLLV